VKSATWKREPASTQTWQGSRNTLLELMSITPP